MSTKQVITMGEVLSRARNQAVKTAEQENPAEQLSNEKKLANIVDSLVSSTEKNASEKSTESLKEDLTKQASELANHNLSNIVKEAQFLGSAMADGFVSRLGVLEQASPTTKVASGDLEKLAAEYEVLSKEAAELGYREATLHLEKIAAEEFAAGEKAAEKFISKVAEASYDVGHIQTLQLLATM